MAKKLQLLRNQTVFENKTTALTSLKAQLVKMSVGEPCLAAYTDEDKVSVLLGIAWDANNFQVFEGAKISEGGELEIPEEVINEITKQINIIIGGASNDYNTLKKIEDKVKGLQSELDATQVGAGLEANGGYTADSGTTYLKDATSLKDADKKLDAQVKANADAITKNKVVAGNGIDVNASGANTTVSVKLDAADKVLTLSGEGLKTNINLTWDKAQGLKLIGKDNTVLATIPATDFIKDGMLKNVELVVLSEGTETNPQELEDGTYLKFTFNTDASKTEIYVNVTSLIDVYTAGNGIAISGKSISAKVKEDDTILKNSAEGLYVDKASLDAQIGDCKYKSALSDSLTTPSKHGGLAAGVAVSELKKKTLSQLFDDILFEEINPTVKAPSASIAPKGTWAANGIYEVGAAAPSNATEHFTIGFDRGVCTVVGQSNKNRAGAETSREVKYKSAALNPEQKIELGEMAYTVTISHAQGDELKTSKGNKATKDSTGAPISQNPLPAGSVNATTKINGTYPFFCNGASASSSNQDPSLPSTPTPDTKLPLQKWTDTLVGAKFASEASTSTRLVFEFPSQKNVTKVEFFNTVSGKWEVFATSNYTISDAGKKKIQNIDVAYKKLTTQGAMSGALQLRFTVADAGGRKLLNEPDTYQGEPITDEIFRMVASNSANVPFMPYDLPMVMASSTGNRPSGVASFAVNFEPGGQAPLDARTLVPTKADLIAAATYSAKNYYKGMLVVVLDDGGSPALYVLKDVAQITNSNYSGWSKVDAQAAKVIAGNGITVNADGKTISVKVKEADPILEVTGDGLKVKDAATWDCGTY